jgi:hypothetical protein
MIMALKASTASSNHNINPTRSLLSPLPSSKIAPSRLIANPLTETNPFKQGQKWF